jgi:LuxR family maltose regulon positive regulatory protein
MPELIIRTRITPPKSPSNIVRRERLLDQLSRDLDKGVILVCAPAGYGKTTLVQCLLDKGNINYAWLHASEDISTVYGFFNYLVHSLKQLNPTFGDAAIQIIETIREEEKRFAGIDNIIEEITGNFVNDFCANFPGDTYLVIDDLHNLRDYEWVRIAFDKLTEVSPENLHLIITSRTVPEFNLTRLAAKRKLVEVKAEELNFTRDEIAALLSGVYSMQYSEDDLKFLHEQLNGWITGIHLIIQAYGTGFSQAHIQKGTSPLGPPFFEGESAVPENIFNYFADEIFAKLDTETRQFLLDTAMLDIIIPPVCDELLNLKNSGRIVADLMSKNIFIQAVFDRNETAPVKYFSYLELFRKFLMWKLYELKSKTEIRLLLQKYYQYYLAQNDTESAIRFCLLSGEYAAAIPLIKDHFPVYFEQGKFETLWRWLEPLDESVLSQFPELIYFKGLLYKYYLGNIESSLNYVERAISLLEGKAPEEFLFNCYVSRAEILLNLGRNTEVIRSLSRLSETPAAPENKAKVLYFLAYSHFMSSNYAAALDLSNKSLEICTEHSLKDIQLDNFTVLANIYINRGEYVKATYYYEKIVEKSTNLFKKYLSFCNLVLVYSRSGKFDRAREHISEAEKLLHKFITPIFQTAFLLANFSIRFDSGDYEQCIKLLEKINRIAGKTGRKDYVSLTYEQLAETCYYLKNLSRAKEYLTFSKDYTDENNKMSVFDFNFTDSILKKKGGELEGLEAKLLDAYSFYTEHNLFEYLAKTTYHLADLYMKSGMPETAEKYLRESLSIGADKEYVSYFQRELLDTRTLFDYAIEHNIEKSFVMIIIESAADRTNYDWLSADCKERIKQEAENLYDITMECFGGIDFKVRGKRIPEERWIRKKRKLILAYFLLHPDIFLTKDRIIDLFYPDTPMASSDNIFHQTISNIRSVLRVYDHQLAKENPQFILYEDKILKLNPDYMYRVDALEFKRLYSSAYSAGISAEKKAQLMRQAVDLYKGELLSGCYDQWCEDFRHTYQNMFMKITEDLIEILKAEKNYDTVVSYSEKLLHSDRLNEGAYLNIIEAQVKLNNINRAREKFSQMLKTFEEELGEKPTNSTLEKIRQWLGNTD